MAWRIKKYIHVPHGPSYVSASVGEDSPASPHDAKIYSDECGTFNWPRVFVCQWLWVWMVIEMVVHQAEYFSQLLCGTIETSLHCFVQLCRRWPRPTCHLWTGKSPCPVMKRRRSDGRLFQTQVGRQKCKKKKKSSTPQDIHVHNGSSTDGLLCFPLQVWLKGAKGSGVKVQQRTERSAAQPRRRKQRRQKENDMKWDEEEEEEDCRPSGREVQSSPAGLDVGACACVPQQAGSCQQKMGTQAVYWLFQWALTRRRWTWAQL